MDFYMLNNMNNETQKNSVKHLNKKKIIKLLVIIIILLLVIAMVILYIKNTSFRDFFDVYIFRKEVYENNLNSITLNDEDNNYAYAFNKSIVVLNANTLYIYNSSGKDETSLNVEITNPIFDSSNEFLVIAEESGDKLYVISDNNILWQKNVDGDIINVTINENGYVAVIISNTSYKTIITTYDSNGNLLFNKFLATKSAIDATISEDNKYLAIAEADFSGSLIQSNIEIILIENQESNYNYVAESNKMIVNVEYQEKDKLVCMYDDSIHIIENNNDTEFIQYDYKSTLFIDINLTNNIAQIEKISSGLLNSNSQIKFTNITNNSTHTYELGGIPKNIYSYKDVTAVNLGTEVVFIKSNGMLVKRYKSSQEVSDIILSGNIAGIVYKNKIEIVDL